MHPVWDPRWRCLCEAAAKNSILVVSQNCTAKTSDNCSPSSVLAANLMVEGGAIQPDTGPLLSSMLTACLCSVTRFDTNLVRHLGGTGWLASSQAMDSVSLSISHLLALLLLVHPRQAGSQLRLEATWRKVYAALKVRAQTCKPCNKSPPSPQHTLSHTYSCTT